MDDFSKWLDDQLVKTFMIPEEMFDVKRNTCTKTEVMLAEDVYGINPAKKAQFIGWMRIEF